MTQMLQDMLGCPLNRFSNPFRTKAEQLSWHQYVFVPLPVGPDLTCQAMSMALLGDTGQKHPDIRAKKAVLGKLNGCEIICCFLVGIN